VNADRILVALCAAFVCFILGEFIANFGRLAVVLLYAASGVLILCALYWWFQQCKQTCSKSSIKPTGPTRTG
jgi:hypothetical protein